MSFERGFGGTACPVKVEIRMLGLGLGVPGPLGEAAHAFGDQR